MDELVMMGKDTLEKVCELGQFFFPKIALSRIESEGYEVAQYDSDTDNLQAMLRVVALGGPIEWIAHTADSYQFDGDPDSVDDMAIAHAIENGLISPKELFETDDPRAVEALAIVKLDRFGFDSAVIVPYKRTDSGVLQWGEPQSKNGGEGNVLAILRTAITASLMV